MIAPVARNDQPADATTAPEGARLELLRAGSTGEGLFLVPGIEGDPSELVPLASAFTGPQAVYAVAPLPLDAQRRPVASVERMAELMVAAVRRCQPHGPYHLGGYSFGALVALEMAQKLRAAGESVGALFLIEAVYDDRYWPRPVWLRALVRRTGSQLGRIVRMRPVDAIGEVRLRGSRLVQRVRRRKVEGVDPLHAQPSGTAAALVDCAYAAMAGYRPRPYDGAMTLVASSVDRHFGCDTATLWHGYARRLEVQRVDGDHLTVVQDPASAAALARLIEHRIAVTRPGWDGLRPVPGFERPMILTTMRWFSAARLAHALAEAGFAVSACRPRSHPLDVVEGLTGDCRLARVRRLRSVAAAIRQVRPDVILADDERALALLRRLYARTPATDRETAAVIARSLGNVEDWPSITSRAALAERARELGVPAPRTETMGDAEALSGWASRQPPPVVLKTDGSWGGRGVAIVPDPSRLGEAWRAVSTPPTLPRAAKRLVVNRELDPLSAWVRRERPVVNAQQYVRGREAIATAACLDGRVQALVCLEVVQATEARGPAAVVRTIDHPAMAEAARRLVARFGLSGFCGFDFVLTETGEAYLLELNPRVTPTAYLLLEGDHRHGRTVALFPPDMVLDAEPALAAASVLDVPVRSPALVRYGQRLVARRHRPVARMARRLKRRLVPSRY